MGFGTFASSVATDGLSKATALLGDFAPLVAVVFSLAVLGLLLRVVASFMPR